jgi:hypothetical protein
MAQADRFGRFHRASLRMNLPSLGLDHGQATMAASAYGTVAKDPLALLW